MIEISNITKRYGALKVVDDLSLTISKGKAFGFLGQNGAGKTTTMKMIVGITYPDSGSITIEERPSSDLEFREKIGFMPEAPYFYDRLTGLEFMEFANRLYPPGRQKNRAELEELLKRAGIHDARHRSIAEYSKGMKQRLGFAQALVNDPEYVFLDEPLDGLDPIGRREIKNIIKSLRAEGRTIFFNSHILYDTEELCDEIGIIHKGKLLWSGAVSEFCGKRPLEERFIETVESYEKEHRPELPAPEEKSQIFNG